MPTHSEMACARLAAAFAAALAVALPAANAHAATTPQGLHAFALRADEAVSHTFSRTPSFAWSPVSGAKSYEFELATSKRFTESGIVWSTEGVKSPAVAVPVSLPWMTGNPYSLYAHVRALTRKGPGPWSAPFGFNMRWPSVPTPQLPAYPGLLRWNKVPGASGYMVWMVDSGRWFTTRSNMADEREYYAFHQDAAWTGTVHWRVRAMRWLYGDTDNGIPSVSYGPWSPVYANYNPPFATGPLTALATVSDVISDATNSRTHDTTPAFIYSGDTSIWAQPSELYRVLVFTDEDCLNTVFRGAIVGSPAYVPREIGPLAMPTDVNSITDARTHFLSFGAEPESKTADGLDVKTNEMDTVAASDNSHTGLPVSQVVNAAKVDLWDSDWDGGRYYWTVMPVDEVPDSAISTTLANPSVSGATVITVANSTGIGPGDTLLVGTPAEKAIISSVVGNSVTLASGLSADHAAGEPVVRPSGGVTYQDAELTQDACAAGRVGTFAKSSDPVVTGQADRPFASGLSPAGKLSSARSSKPSFYGPPLVAWEPLVGADQYELQWSRTLYPWRTTGSQLTYGTSLTLPLSPGTWYYRVRGLDYLMTGKKPQLSWSDPVRVVVTKPRFRVIH